MTPSDSRLEFLRRGLMPIPGRRERSLRPGLEGLEDRTLLTWPPLPPPPSGYPTATTLQVAPISSVSYGTQVTLTAHVTLNDGSGFSVPDGGTVVFTVGPFSVLGKRVGMATIGGGVASITTTALPAGTDPLTAYYFGGTFFDGQNESDFDPSSSSTVQETVSPDPLTVTADPASRVDGGPEPALTASYSGFVNNEGPTALRGSLVITDETAATAAPGTYAGALVPSGLTSSNYTITFDPGTLTVNAGTATSTTVSASTAASVYGQPVTYTATVLSGSAAASSGFVQFELNGVARGNPVAVSAAGTAVAPFSTLAVGPEAVEADFYDYLSYLPSEGSTSESVSAAATSTALTLSSAAPYFGISETATANVAALAPSAATPAGGTVQFAVDGADFGSPVAVVGGVASISLGALALGDHAVSATYGGTASFSESAGSTSFDVVPANTTTTVAASSAEPGYGQAVTFTATVASPTSAPPSVGSVQFLVDGVDFGAPVTVSGGLAWLSTASLPSGPHAIAAKYAGDADLNASSGSTSIAVLPGVVSISRSSPSSSETTGPGVTYAVTFSEPVTGVSAADFGLVTTGTISASPTLAISGGGASYLVTASGIGGGRDDRPRPDLVRRDRRRLWQRPWRVPDRPAARPVFHGRRLGAPCRPGGRRLQRRRQARPRHRRRPRPLTS